MISNLKSIDLANFQRRLPTFVQKSLQNIWLNNIIFNSTTSDQGLAS